MKKKWDKNILNKLEIEFEKAADDLDFILDLYEEDYEEEFIKSLPINVLENYFSFVQAIDVKTDTN